AVEREDVCEAGLGRLALQDAGDAVAQQTGAASELEREPLRRPDDGWRVREECCEGLESSVCRRGREYLRKPRRVRDLDLADPLPVADEQEAVVVRQHPVGQRLDVPKPLLRGLEPPAEVRARRLRLDEPDEARSVLE